LEKRRKKMASKVTVTGLSGLAANFRAFDERCQELVLQAQQENGAEHRQRMYGEAPKDTHFMADHTEVRYSAGGYTYEVGYWEEAFTQGGLPFYPPFVAFGTSRMSANEWMFRATEPMREISRQRVGDAIKAAAAESAKE
jgi:hypothetical protein